MFLRQFEYLEALAREQHFGRAALACHVSQPALSAAIRSFERELGVPLVRRGRRFEGITPEGQRVLVWARRVLGDLDGLDQEVSRLRGGLAGTLRLGAIPTALPASTLITTRFRQRHPRMRIQLRSMTSREIADGLSTGELDAGLTYLDNEPLTDVQTSALWREHYLLLTPAEGPPSAGVTISWAAASELPLCLLTTDMQHRRIVDAAFASAGVTPDPVLETNSVSTLIAHARDGLPGVTAQTWLVSHHLQAGLRATPLVEPIVEHTIGIVAPLSAQPTPVVTELLALCTPLELDEEVRRRSAA
ncbi:MAG TPA: LysR family transcriptional regulator [Thermoleophilaceae bacterium]|nr:LysR family transcriptional regulator [Thermoleophilaceae bacterium]